MKNFTKTLAAAAIVIFSTGIESASARRIAADAAELKSSEVKVENTTSDIAMPRYATDKSFDVEIHETEANDIAMPRYATDKSFDVEIHEIAADAKADSAASLQEYMDKFKNWLLDKIKNPDHWC